MDNARYSVETRIIDDQMVSSSNFASGEFTPTGACPAGLVVRCVVPFCHYL